MSNEHVDAPPPSGASIVRNKGQTLVDAFRAQRLSARPALRAELHGNRQILQRQRLDGLGLGAREPAPAAAPSKIADLIIRSCGEPANSDADGSIFATYCDAAAAPPPLTGAVPPATPPPAENASVAPIMSEPMPLSVIGFGPGMTMRMGQLGIMCVADLAAADAGSLGAALGDLSELVHADLWIASARKACGS